MTPCTISAARSYVFAAFKEYDDDVAETTTSTTINDAEQNSDYFEKIQKDYLWASTMVLQDVSCQSCNTEDGPKTKQQLHPVAEKACAAFHPSDIEIMNEIGRGSQSRVFRGRDTRTGEMYAIKVIDCNFSPKYTDRELDVHKSLGDFPGIVKLHGYYQQFQDGKQSVCLVLELCDHTLLELMKQNPHGRLPEPDAAKYFIQIVEALKYIHSKGVIHRDIKLANVLISKNGVVKIADFGVATRTRCPKDRKSIIGTTGYMAPEIHGNSAESESGVKFLQKARDDGAGAGLNLPLGLDLYDSKYDTKVDLYSLGVTLYVMLTGTELQGETNASLGFNFGFDGSGKAFFDFTQSVLNFDALDLILGLLDEDPTQRLTLDEVLHHPWLIQFRCRDSSFLTE